MTLNLNNPLELTVLEHMCEAYLYWALYASDFCTLLVWEDYNRDIINCLQRHLKMWNDKKDGVTYDPAVRAMAWDLQTLQQKMLECY